MTENQKIVIPGRLESFVKPFLFPARYLVWFSCGAASAVAAKIATERFKGECLEVCYCDTLKYEHPDNIRFMGVVSDWIERPIKILKSEKYEDIMDVFRKRHMLRGPVFAPCTEAMKKDVRLAYAGSLDIHVFGFTVDEQARIDRYEKMNQQLWCEWVLRDAGITKKDCYDILRREHIELPVMYRMGYKNNNCIGCVKGGSGYWNKIRRDFPARFEEMARLEDELGATICKMNGERIRLHDLPEGVGRYEEEDIECGVLCTVDGGA